MLRLLAVAGCALLCGACSVGGAGSVGSAGGSPAASASVAPPPVASPSVAVTPSASRSAAPSPSTSSHPPASSHPSTRVPLPNVTFPAGTGPIVVLNPGHNGDNWAHPAEIDRQVPAGFGREKACDTTGTNTNAGYAEHAFNWDVALRVRAILQAHGVRVVLTRPNDTGVGPCVDARAAIGNRPGVAAVVSIHADGAPSAGHGFHVNLDSRTPEGATAATVARSEALGRAEHDALANSSGLVPSTYIGKDGYVYRDDFAGLNLSSAPTTFLELGNMRNAGDAALQSSASGRARIAAAVASGILTFLH